MGEHSESIQILFLGTGAADWPASHKPSEDDAQGAYRGFSSLLVDGRILIDCGPTVPQAIERFGVDASQISDILLTHTHRDHCDVEAIRRLASHGGVALWAHPVALSKVPEVEGLRRCPVDVGQAIELPSLSATALAANHSCGEETPLHFLLQKQGCSLLYATDGAWLLKDTWQHLREQVLDAIIWDATCGDSRGDWRIFEHNSVDMIRIMRQTLEKEGVLRPRSRVFLTHMARTLCAPHSVMTEALAPEGLIPAYDGMEASIGGAEPSTPDDASQRAAASG